MEHLNQYLASHHGVLSRRQALGLGLTPGQIQHRVKSGAWVRVHASVYRVASAPQTWEADTRAAALSACGLAGRGTALRVWRVDGYEQFDSIHIITRSQRSARSMAMSSRHHLHRTSSFDMADGRLVDGIPVTGPARSVLDLAAVADDRELDCVIDAVIRDRLVGVDELLATVASHGTVGRAGAGRLLRLLQARQAVVALPDSRFNRLVGQLLIDAGLGKPQYEYEVRVGGRTLRADLAYPGECLAIECDSARWHWNRRSFEEDPRRRNLLLAAGYRVLSFTWRDYTDDPDGIVATVAATLATGRRLRDSG